MNKRAVMAVMGILLAALAGACGGSDGVDLQLSGTWNIISNLVSNTCNFPNVPLGAGEIQITQNGDQVTFSGSGFQATGTLDGNRLTVQGTLTASVTSTCDLTVEFTLSGTATNTRIIGTLEGTIELDAASCGVTIEQCSGTIRFTMTPA